MHLSRHGAELYLGSVGEGIKGLVQEEVTGGIVQEADCVDGGLLVYLVKISSCKVRADDCVLELLICPAFIVGVEIRQVEGFESVGEVGKRSGVEDRAVHSAELEALEYGGLIAQLAAGVNVKLQSAAGDFVKVLVHGDERLSIAVRLIPSGGHRGLEQADVLSGLSRCSCVVCRRGRGRSRRGLSAAAACGKYSQSHNQCKDN